MHETWLKILEYARYAPSPHNIQPWKVKIIDDLKAEIYYLPDRLLPKTDPTGRFTIIGFGIFFECIKIAASRYGFSVKEDYPNTEFDYSKTEPTYFATLSLEPSTEKDSLNPELIIVRRTSRLPYDGQRIEESIRKELIALATQYQNNMTITSDPELVDWLIQLNCNTLFYDMSDENARTEVGSWTRASLKEAKAKKDGLAAYALGFPGWLVSLFMHRHELMELPIIKNIIRTYYLSSMKGTTTIAWLQSSFTTPQDWIRNGHLLARLWLTLTKYHIYLHPFGSIITNPKAHKELIDRIKVTEGAQEAWLIMRLGYSAEPPRSQRLNLTEILYE